MLNRLKILFYALFSRVFCLTSPNRWSSFVALNLSKIQNSVPTPFGNINIIGSDPISLWRSGNVTTKEVETIEWIETFKDQEIFYDIGGNIGLYSLLAAKKGLSCYTFEPVFFNYSLLNRNIEINQLSKKIKSFCLAIGNKTEQTEIHLSSTAPATAFHSTEMDDISEIGVAFSQGALSITLDDLIENFSFPTPHYIKIDVDGREASIIEGAQKTLQENKLKGLLIEIDNHKKEDHDMLKSIQNFGFAIFKKGPIAEKTGHQNIILHRS